MSNVSLFYRITWSGRQGQLQWQAGRLGQLGLWGAVGIKGCLNQTKSTIFGRFHTPSVFPSRQLYCIHFLYLSSPAVQCKSSFLYRLRQQKLRKNAFPRRTTAMVIAFGLCFFMPSPVQLVCLDLNDNDVDELLFYHNTIRASVDPRAVNMRQWYTITY